MFVFQNVGYKKTYEPPQEAQKKTPSPTPYKTENKLLATGEYKVADWMGPSHNPVTITTNSAAEFHSETRFYYNPNAPESISASVKIQEWHINVPNKLSDLKLGENLKLGLNTVAVVAKELGKVANPYLDLAHVWKEKTELNAGDNGVIDAGEFIVRLKANDANKPPIVIVADKKSGDVVYNSADDKKFTTNYLTGEIGFADKNGVPFRLWITNLTPGANGADQKANIAIVNDTWHLTHNGTVKHNGKDEQVEYDGTYVPVVSKFCVSGESYSNASNKFRIGFGSEIELPENGSFPSPSLVPGTISNDGPLQREGEDVKITSNGTRIKFYSDAGDLCPISNGTSSTQKYKSIEYDTSDNLYYLPNGTATQLDAIGTLKLQVKKDDKGAALVTGNGALFNVGMDDNMTPMIAITENTRNNTPPSTAQPGDYVTSYTPYSLIGGRANFGDVEYKGRGTSRTAIPGGQNISENTTKVKVAQYGIDVSLSTDPDKSKITLSFNGDKIDVYETPTIVRETRAMKEQTKVFVYPNPTHGQLTIQLPGTPSNATHLELFDNNGSFVLTVPIKGNDTSINLGNLPSGAYNLQYTDTRTGQSSNTKVVLKK